MCPYFVLVYICMYECMCGLHVCGVCTHLNTYVQGQRSLSVPSAIALHLLSLRQGLALNLESDGHQQAPAALPSLPDTALGLQTPILRFLCGSEDSNSGPYTCSPRTPLSPSNRLGSACQCLLAFRVVLCCLSLVLWHVPGVSTVTVRTEWKPHYVRDGQ